APRDGAWWQLSWAVRAGDRAKETADWITERVGLAPSDTDESAAATWPVMLTAAAVALASLQAGQPVTVDGIVTVIQDPKMRRYSKPRSGRSRVISELESPEVIEKIAEIIADALSASTLRPEDQLLVLQSTAAGVCASLWHTP